MKKQLGTMLCMAFVFVGGLHAFDRYGLSSPRVSGINWWHSGAKSFRLEFRAGKRDGAWILILPGKNSYLIGGDRKDVVLRIGDFHEGSSLNVLEDPAAVQNLLRDELLVAHDASEYADRRASCLDDDANSILCDVLGVLANLVADGDNAAGLDQGAALMQLIDLLDAEAKGWAAESDPRFCGSSDWSFPCGPESNF